ncbi:MAG: amino acid adenylation domain-containing protein [Desulfobacterales bacterium]|nr:amino acid adenylation domain-containing protein [Desulfobacterales bacterium]
MIKDKANHETADNISSFSYQEVREQVMAMLPQPVALAEADNLLEFGLNSLKIMRLTNNWRRAGAQVTFVELISTPFLKDWWILLQKTNEECPAEDVDTIEKEVVKATNRPFQLSDVQYAYWIGRRADQTLGGVGCHAYLELDGKGIDPGRLEFAWHLLLKHHSMLRAKFLADGQQEIMEAPYKKTLPVNDLVHYSEQALPMELNRIRNRLSHRCLEIEKGEVAGLELSLLPKGYTRLHFDIDLLVADVQSFQIILRDLAAAYNRGFKPPAPVNWQFSEYLNQKESHQAADIKKAAQYWKRRLPDLPAAPGLPLKKKPEAIRSPVFKRKSFLVKTKDWENLKNRSAAHQVTPAMVLLTGYADTLDRWSTNSRFLINIPLFDRPTHETGVEDVVADFSNLLLLSVDCSQSCSFLERVRAIQNQFHKDMAHTAYSGVRIQRDMARIYKGPQTFAPVVFACNLGVPLINEECREALGKLSYMISQTPQVWLDFQIYEEDEGLLLCWDSVEGLFPEGLIDDMFGAYTRLIEWLTTADNDWHASFNPFPASRDQIRDRKTEKISPESHIPESLQCLHTAFFDFAAANPRQTALIESRTKRHLTYGELSEYALRVAAFLREKGVRQGDPVAVTLPRGMDQIVAVFGILAIGACYVPIGIEQPAIRRERIHKKAKIHYVLSNREYHQKTDWPDNTAVFDIRDSNEIRPLAKPETVSPQSLAYIIFTSGSTGEPKGVEIEHAGAWNTISDINRRYQVGPDDRVLAVSSLDFDLSVYDIFGLLSAGGSLVLITENTRRDASHWLNIANTYQVTLWNSVPILLEMLLVVSESKRQKDLPFRLALLSGDWVGLDIPERLQRVAENCCLVALGGATEASIWSNFFEVTLPLSPDWKSIPYGRPLAKQAYRVVDDKGRDCPDWVAGELWIGGVGVARGYRHDPGMTADRFVDRNGSRWYRTGDMGKYLPDGNIEFLGRRDHQVKIRGHRIELGEIETAIKQHPEVRDAVVTVLEDPQGNKRLLGYVVPDLKEASVLFEEISADPKKDPALWADLEDLGSKQARQPLSGEIEPEDFPVFWKYMEDISTTHICSALIKTGAFRNPGESYTIPSLIHQFGLKNRYQVLLEQWFRILKDKGWLKKNETGAFGNAEMLSPESFKSPVPDRTYPAWEEQTQRLSDYLMQLGKHLEGLLKGDTDPLALFFSENSFLAPDDLIQQLPGAEHRNRIAQRLVETVAQKSFKNNSPIQVLEIGSRCNRLTESFLSLFNPDNTEYTCTDNSIFFTSNAKEKLKDYPFVHYRQLDINQDPQNQGYNARGYDLIIASNSLHRARDIKTALAYTQSLLKPGGLLFLLEMTRNSRLQQITTGFLEDGFTRFKDERQQTRLPLLSVKQWQKNIRSQHFAEVMTFPGHDDPAGVFGQHIITARAPENAKHFKPEKLTEFLSTNLPGYMIPSGFSLLDELPLTANGKIDRKKLSLSDNIGISKPEKTVTQPRTSTEKTLVKIWRRLLEIEQISVFDSFFELGGDSLLATRLSAMVRTRFEIDLPLGNIFEGPTIAELSQQIRALKNKTTTDAGRVGHLPQIVPDPDQRYQPFPLTDIQHAYWIGRSGVYSLGNVATHCYFEIENTDLDIQRINDAWNRLIDHHDMMRAVILPDGNQQKILKKVPPYQIEVKDLRNKSSQDADIELKKIRKAMSHRILSADTWPLFHLRVSRFNRNRVRLHIGFDNLIFDGWSMFHLLYEWTRLYNNPEAHLPIHELSFRDYVLAVNDLKESDLYQRDRKYWMDRLPDLPPAPELPLAQTPDRLSKQRFNRLDTRLNSRIWQRLKKRSMEAGLTPSGILLTAYAEVLGMWSKRPEFTINLTQFNRLPLHLQVNDVVGDFTTLTLLAVDNSSGKTFFERGRNLQRRLWQDLDHPYFSGVEVQRELAKTGNRQQGRGMPIVFTSALGVDRENQGDSEGKWMGELIYNITQTPQVWLDHQVLEQDGELVLIWDFVEGLFPEGLLDEMFGAYCDLLQRLSEEDNAWQEAAPTIASVPVSEKRIEANQTRSPVSPETLFSLFAKQAVRQPDHPAVISPDRTLTYEELFRRSSAVHDLLCRSGGPRPGTLVAVVMEKGWEQVVAVLGILQSGAAYLPIDPSNPEERQWHILNDAGIQTILTQSWVEKRLNWPERIECFSIDQTAPPKGVSIPTEYERKTKPEDLAYVIYTSGSTGLPKGVMIDHQGVVNTILDVNTSFSVRPEDRILALSNLNFDLSVYDIFGILAAGATLVIPEAEKIREPSHWLELINREQVTIWNTVPALMQMMVEDASGNSGTPPQSLRLVLLSGDWIPLGLPDRIREMVPKKIDITSLGGATEASIWSCYYPIQAINPDWKSIPYGRPMANQRFYVMNSFFEECPDWVPGRLYIAGTGLAKGYWHNEEKTAAAFIRHPRTGERLYKTGDLGRYLPDGNIEFLGREDFQVKIRGNRIELGEIEAVLKLHPLVREAVVTTIGETRGKKYLAGYVVPDRALKKLTEELDSLLKCKLPDYMVPPAITVLDSIPLTPNGKIDRKALPVPDKAVAEPEKPFISPRTKTEVLLARMWTKILGIDRISINDNFFELGGDSLLAVRFVSRLRQTLQVELPLRELFESPSIIRLSEHIERERKDKNNLTMLPEIVPVPKNRHLPFPLTDIQQAYWIGRRGEFELGNIATHLYFEIESGQLNLEQLNRAWHRVVDRHDMLRAVILPDGNQKVLKQVPRYQFKIMDLRDQNRETAAARLDATRREMSHQVLLAEKWPLFDIRASLLKDGLIRLHVSWDALIADAWSFFSFTNDWYEIYRNPGADLTPLDVSFRDYVLAEADLEESQLYRRAREYWSDRLPDLPPAPELPLAREPGSIKQPRFNRRSFTIAAQHWQHLKDRAMKNNLTPSGLLVAAFADILGTWSKKPNFTINLTLFNRLPLHPQVNMIVGDFTSTILLGIENPGKEGFKARASRLQQQLWQDLDHRYFSGVRVLRELARLQGDFKKSVMPVVFTSALNLDALGSTVSGVNKLGEMIYGISQTPQVWLDHQVYEQNENLVLTWDAVEDLFPGGMLDDMFTAYCDFLQRLSKEEEAWQNPASHLIPGTQLEKRRLANATDAPVSPELLHTLFSEQASRQPDHPAVIASGRTLSYGALFEYASHTGGLLQKKGAVPNSLVAVFMEKGWEQAAAVLGVLYAGAAYLPIDPELPEARIRHLLADGNINLVLTQSWIDEKLEWPEGVQRYFVDKITPENENIPLLKPVQRPEDLAYVIYTSGSTGLPKGVMIDHQGAVNTILDINKRFSVGPDDRILAISNLNFDLSVYDIFGTLAAGGTIVFPDPDQTREPSHWMDLMIRNRITVWNSVPALMQMFEEYLSAGIEAVPQSLRLILLSGDWIPLELPDRIKRHFDGVQVIGLGGATEASIWSNLYPIEQVDPNWKSIPYGYPMLNQRYHIFNELMENCPEWVPGQLYIGGIGLAKGYWRDEEKTRNSFIVCPQTGEKLYRTGDFGRYLPDGSMEFLGREDFQLKINGYRIESGEIETALKQIPGVKDAVVIATNGTAGRKKQLTGCVVPDNETESVLFESRHADSSGCASRWESIRSTGQEQASKIPDTIDMETVPAFINSVDHLSAVIMCQVLNDMGLFSLKKKEYTFDRIMDHLNVHPRYQTLLHHWLEALEAEGILKKTESGGYLKRGSINKNEPPFSSNFPEELKALYLSLRENSPLYTGLFKGNIDPTELLLTEDTVLNAQKLERIAPGRDYYLNLAGRLFRTIIDTFPLNKKLQILEVGTRAGNLTASLLPLLPEERGSYRYTDESPFFTDKLKEKLGNPIPLEYGLLDINRAPDEQGYEPYAFDVIIADKTLHRATHLKKTLAYVKSLLAPGGLLFVTEPTRNNRLMFITVGFFEDGFAHFEDERKTKNLPFIPVNQWRDLLEKTGFSKTMAFPEEGHAANVFEQHLIVAQAPETARVFKSSNMVAALREKLPDYMVPARYRVLDKLPLSANMKVDRNALAKMDKRQEQTPRQTYVAPSSDNQIKIAAIWEEMLDHTRIGVHDSFFELGGDSLRAIQSINRLKEVFQVDLSLREFFEEADVERLARKIEEKLEKKQNLNMEEGEI